jgi:hypothetical protein
VKRWLVLLTFSLVLLALAFAYFLRGVYQETTLRGQAGEIEGLGVEAEEIAETASRLNELIDRKARQSQPPGL